MIDHYQAPRYIVDKNQMLNGVRWALELTLNKSDIVDSIMRDVENEIETLLDDDCQLLDDFIEEMRGNEKDDLMEDLPSAQPRWIPVTERLPEDGSEVCVLRISEGT